jgi:MSHA biogenesis protein MshN
MHVGTPAERAETEFRKATGLLNQGRVAEAIDGYKSALQQDPRHGAARQALVGLLLENRRIDEAQQFLQEGLTLNPDRSNYAMLLARIQVERGDLQGAHDLLSQHAASAANNADYHAFDAALLQRLGRHKEAVAGYQAALRLAPRAGVWWMGMGISLQADNHSAEALDAFTRAKSAGGLSPDLLSFIDQRMKQLQ